MPDWSQIADHIAATTATAFTVMRDRAVGGGSINSAHVLEGDAASYFVKLNEVRLLDMFEAEAAGVEELRAADAVRIPRAVCSGVSGNQCYLVLEYIPLGGKGDGRKLGEQLAALHRRQQRQFGWTRDNTIGSTPQPNAPDDDWVSFYRERRLGFQFALAQRNGAGGRLMDAGRDLMESLPAFFADYRPVPSLLHGDLWGGNWSGDRDGNPVIFDPAVYYGDREADLAMTELFGGFPGDFYSAYDSTWPLDPGYATRKTLYNLYHVLNHFNLFGGGYLSQAQHMTASLLSELR
jgi:protein-ribulosamine 3-kinase